jgi:hypothetical protein
MNKKGMSKPSSCKFHQELESIHHLFFDCVVAKVVWEYACEFCGYDIGMDYVYAASKWLSKEKFYVANTISTAVLRGIWLTLSDFVFNKQQWTDV